MNKEQYVQIREEIEIDEISYGYRTVTLFSEDELGERQKGYSVHALTGEKIEEWKDNWLVIGDEDLVGDPLFIDLQAETLPVYTAAHGEGVWNPVLIATSLEGFIQALLEMQSISAGRSNPVELECNPLPEETHEQILKRISELTFTASLEFWESWFEV